MIKLKKVLSTLSLAVILASSTVCADTQSTVLTQNTEVDGTKLLKESYAYLGALDKYAFRATVTNDIDVDGQSVTDKRVADVKVNRPDQFRVDSKNDTINRSLYLSSGVFTIMDNNEKYYASVKTGGGIDKTLDRINKKLGIVVPLSTLLHSDMAKFIHPRKVQYFGTRDVGGTACNYIAFKQGMTTVHLWIENAGEPLIRAAKIITDAKDDKGTTDMLISWDTKPSFSDLVFVFKAPKGASHIAIKPAK